MWSFTSAALRRSSRIQSSSSTGQFASKTKRHLVVSGLPGSHLSTRSYSQDRDQGKKTALVLGSSGALGSTVSRYLSRNGGMTVLGADVVEMPNDFNSSDWELDGFISLPTMAQHPSVADVTTELASGIFDILGTDNKIDAIVCASGGWASDPSPMPGHNMKAEDVRRGAQEYGETMDKMMYMNLIPVIAAGFAAQTFMGPNGLFVVIGATAALVPTPGMMGYGMSKAASHHIVQTVGATTGNSIETKAQKKAGRKHRQFGSNLGSMSSIGITPITIDTPSNRQAMPDANFDSWTKPHDIAEEIGTWIETPALRPHSGALVKVSSSAEGSVFDIVR